MEANIYNKGIYGQSVSQGQSAEKPLLSRDNLKYVISFLDKKDQQSTASVSREFNIATISTAQREIDRKISDTASFFIVNLNNTKYTDNVTAFNNCLNDRPQLQQTTLTQLKNIEELKYKQLFKILHKIDFEDTTLYIERNDITNFFELLKKLCCNMVNLGHTEDAATFLKSIPNKHVDIKDALSVVLIHVLFEKQKMDEINRFIDMLVKNHEGESEMREAYKMMLEDLIQFKEDPIQFKKDGKELPLFN